MYQRHLILLMALAFISCDNSVQTAEELFSLPEKIKESSAVETIEGFDGIYTLEDKGNKPQILAMDLQGQLVHTIAITNAQNNDWEDLTSDEQGNLYIGDFGNNDNERKNLAIYKIAAADLNKPQAAVAETISFYYPEQVLFPPKKSERFYDVEAFFVFKDHFYLFTKNRSSKFDGTTFLYKIPNKPGRHPAKLLDSFRTCPDFNSCAITGADVSQDGKRMVLLSSNQVWLFSHFTGNQFLSGKVQVVELGSDTQKEGICFANNETLYITDEKDKKTGGKLYHLKLSESKS